MQVITEIDSGIAHVTVHGDIDIESRAILGTHLDNAISAATRMLIIDLLDVAFMDSSGIGLLVSVHQRLGDGRLAVVAGDGVVSQVLEITAMQHLFPVVESAAAARGLAPGLEG